MTEIKKGPAAQTTEPTETDDEGNGSTWLERRQGWRASLSMADVISHWRYRDMPEASQSLYLDLIQRADAIGCVSTEEVRAVRDMRSGGAEALEGAFRSNLLTVEYGQPVFVLIKPKTLDDEEAAIFRGMRGMVQHNPFYTPAADRSGR